MKISNKVKRNIAAVILLIGIACIIARGWDVVMDPSSGKAWFEFFGIILLTFFCFDSFWRLHKRVRRGIKFGRI